LELPDGRKEFAVGDLVSGEERVLCVALEVLPLPWVQGAPVVSLEGERLLELEILYDEIGESGIVSRVHHQIVRVQATPNPDEVQVNETVVGWMALQKAGLTLKRATDEIAGGSLDKARNILQQTIRFLSQQQPRQKVEQAIQMLNHLLAQVDQGFLSSRDLKMHKMREFYSQRSSSRRPPGPNPLGPPPPKDLPPPSDPGRSGPVA
jgi:hypothetical protein